MPYGSRLNRVAPLAIPLILLALVTAAAGSYSPALSRSSVAMLINVVIVLGIFVFVGNSGIFSFGHTAFMGIGAYVTAFATVAPVDKKFLFPDLPTFILQAHLPTVPAVLVGGVAAAALAATAGIPIVRMTPLAASLATFALLAVLVSVGQNWQAVGGATGVSNVPTTMSAGLGLAWAAAALVAVFLYQRSRTCLRLRASREDESAARSVGAPVERDRYIALLTSAFLVGVGGGLYALNLGFFTPNDFYLSTLFITLVMLLIGGMTSVAGAVVGTVVVSALQEVLRTWETDFALGPFNVPGRPGLQNVVLAILLIIVMIRRPLGLMAGREFRIPTGWRRDHAGERPRRVHTADGDLHARDS